MSVPESELRSKLRILISSFDHHLIRMLAGALKSADPFMRKRAAAILISWGTREAIELLYSHASKYDVPSATVDCPTGIRSGCGVICCRVMFARITPEDLADGIEEHPGMPGFARITPQGCYALEQETNRCMIWEKRPLTCRIFNCKTDPRFAHLMKW
jgi:Fe-S-cluster containining protein